MTAHKSSMVTAPVAFIKELFNRHSQIPVNMSILAEIVAPFYMLALPGKRDLSVGAGWLELADWVRIGFEHEQDKGPDATALIITLRQVADHISRAANTPSQKIFSLPKEDLRVLRATYWQMTAAAEGLRMIAKYQDDNQEMDFIFRKGKRGRPLTPSGKIIPLYNHRDESHEAAADKLDEIRKRLDRFFISTEIKPAPAKTIRRKAGCAPFYN